jgi:hypothetical protein
MLEVLANHERGPRRAAYDAEQFVGIDLDRRRSVICGTDQHGNLLEAVRISNDPNVLTRSSPAPAGPADERRPPALETSGRPTGPPGYAGRGSGPPGGPSRPPPLPPGLLHRRTRRYRLSSPVPGVGTIAETPGQLTLHRHGPLPCAHRVEMSIPAWRRYSRVLLIGRPTLSMVHPSAGSPAPCTVGPDGRGTTRRRRPGRRHVPPSGR